MPVNGLMVTLSSDPECAFSALCTIGDHGGFELGDRQDRWLPVVMDARDNREARSLHGWLEGVAGVEQVDVILVAFDETEP